MEGKKHSSSAYTKDTQVACLCPSLLLSLIQLSLRSPWKCGIQGHGARNWESCWDFQQKTLSGTFLRSHLQRYIHVLGLSSYGSWYFMICLLTTAKSSRKRERGHERKRKYCFFLWVAVICYVKITAWEMVILSLSTLRQPHVGKAYLLLQFICFLKSYHDSKDF